MPLSLLWSLMHHETPDKFLKTALGALKDREWLQPQPLQEERELLKSAQGKNFAALQFVSPSNSKLHVTIFLEKIIHGAEARASGKTQNIRMRFGTSRLDLEKSEDEWKQAEDLVGARHFQSPLGEAGSNYRTLNIPDCALSHWQDSRGEDIESGRPTAVFRVDDAILNEMLNHVRADAAIKKMFSTTFFFQGAKGHSQYLGQHDIERATAAFARLRPSLVQGLSLDEKLLLASQGNERNFFSAAVAAASDAVKQPFGQKSKRRAAERQLSGKLEGLLVKHFGLEDKSRFTKNLAGDLIQLLFVRPENLAPLQRWVDKIPKIERIRSQLAGS